MTAATLVCDERGDGGDSAGESLKYQLTVLAPSVLDAVSCSGGWLFDRVMAGWDVRVYVPNPVDLRPLAVLGASGFELSDGWRPPRKGQHPHALAVAAEMFACDDGIGREVRSALRRASIEVTFWGGDSPVGLDRPLSVAEHPLTAAAYAFKCQALAVASGQSTPVSRTERFFTGGGYRG